MKNLNYTGLDAAKVQPVAEALAILLADFQVYYANLRNFHWNEHRPSKYLQVAQLKELDVVHCGQECLTHVLEMVKTIMAQERAVIAAADEAGDESSNALMSDFLREQEKLVWMLTATLAKDCNK